MLEEFVDSVLVIDDKEEEIEGLKESLEKKDIWVKYLSPNDCKKRIKSRKLLFLDLHIEETAGNQLATHISKIRFILRTIISNENSAYGLIIWTNHIEEINDFKNRIKNDDEYLKPLFIIGLSKRKYIENGYDNLLSDIEEELKKSTAANFFINWSNLIQKGKDKAITSIFELVPDYSKQDKNIEFLLFKMAQNYTGIPVDKIDNDYPLSVDAIKAFNDLLVYEINSIASNLTFLNEPGNIKFEAEDGRNIQSNTKISNVGDELIGVFSEFNSKMLIDYVNIKQDKVIPGNVYEIKKADSEWIHPDLPEGAIPIIIEMTPPCDFSNKKTLYPRVLSGYIVNFDLDSMQKKKPERLYAELWPIKLFDQEKMQAIFFDFSIIGFVKEDDLKDKNKYKLIFRVKDILFADILQKMTSYMSRLGLPIIR